MENKVNVNKVEMEKCVMCGVETNIPRDLHIDLRHGYVEGAGQLCTKCTSKMNI